MIVFWPVQYIYGKDPQLNMTSVCMLTEWTAAEECAALLVHGVAGPQGARDGPPAASSGQGGGEAATRLRGRPALHRRHHRALQVRLTK